jgi:anthranilate synthase component 2
MHGKLSAIMHNGAGIFADVPNEFHGTRYHSLVVDPDTLPECLQITARSGDTIMGMEHKNRRIYGVQFHPESIASEHGHKILKNFLSLADMD